MSSRRTDDGSRSAEVLNLMCARFEAGLAEGQLDEALRAHQSSCERCDALVVDLEKISTWIAQATGPSAEVPEGFLDGVIARASNLDGRVDLSAPSSAHRRGWAAGAVGMLAAAALFAAFWAGGAQEQMRRNAETQQVSVAVPAELPTASPEERTTPTRAMTPTPAPSPTPAPVVALRREPTVPAASPVPEPVVDLGAEIQVMLREKIEASASCPEQNPTAVWVTATVRPDGSLTNRSIMSAGAASEAHRCVSRSLDQLLFPPGSPETTVTFELSW